MRERSPKSPIITIALGAMSLLVLFLTGCSMVRLGYNQAPELTYWWLDGYVDFSDAQQTRSREAVDAWFAWHRRTQLPDYAALLERAQAEFARDATPAQMCRWNDELRARVVDAAAQAVPALADLAIELSPEQIRHIERRFEKSMKDFRSDYLQPSPEERLEASVKRVVDRMQMVYGELTEAQLSLISAGVQASPFDAVTWGTERRERQKNLLAALRRLKDERADTSAARAAVRQLIDEGMNSPQPAYRAYQQRLIQYNCGLAAQLHNSTSAEQRQNAAKRLRGWADDVRALSGHNGS